jgi:hypothetical protein
MSGFSQAADFFFPRGACPGRKGRRRRTGPFVNPPHEVVVVSDFAAIAEKR